MITSETDDISFASTVFFLKLAGVWMSADRDEQRRRNIALVYTVGMIFFGVYIQTTDFYYSKDDFGDLLYTMCNILSVVMSLMKILVLLAHKNEFFNLILYFQQRFLSPQSEYDPYEKSIMKACKRSCAIFIIPFTVFAHLTVISYIIGTLVENVGRNESDRVLPFNLWLDLPWSITPYFEIIFLIQTLSLYQIGVCYFCFDNCLCIMNLHTATQFRILQYRLANMENINMREYDQKKYLSSFTKNSYDILRSYIQQHQALIAYCNNLEKVFSLIALGQILIFSLLICCDGCQVLMADAHNEKRFIFVFHLVSCVGQLLMFAYSCDGLMHESLNVGKGAYETPWPYLTMDKYGTAMRKDLIVIIARSKVPCCLTAQGFFEVSLKTYTSVLSTAFSYFMLLKQTMENKDNI